MNQNFKKKSVPKSDSNGVSIFEAHVLALLGQPITSKLIGVSSGAQIVKRVTKKAFKTDIISPREKGLDVIEYENAIHNRELLRIQSREGIMRDHGKFNDLGNFIASCIR